MRIFSLANVGTKRRSSSKRRKASSHPRRSSDGQGTRMMVTHAKSKCRAERCVHVIRNDRKSSHFCMCRWYFALTLDVGTCMCARIPVGKQVMFPECQATSNSKRNRSVISRLHLINKPVVMVFPSCALSSFTKNKVLACLWNHTVFQSYARSAKQACRGAIGAFVGCHVFESTY